MYINVYRLAAATNIASLTGLAFRVSSETRFYLARKNSKKIKAER
jgi:hypothetical protein